MNGNPQIAEYDQVISNSNSRGNKLPFPDKQMVTVLTSEDEADRRFVVRSVTRHLIWKGGDWVGANPDERTRGFHATAAENVAAAEANVAKAELELKKLQALQVKRSEERKAKKTKPVLLDKALAVNIEAVENDLLGARAALEAAKTAKAEVERAFPLQCRFVPRKN